MIQMQSCMTVADNSGAKIAQCIKGGRATHGSKFHREAGGTGSCTTPGHCFKNVKMPGRMGFERITVQNLRIVKIDPELKVILVRGAVPGNKDCTLIVKSAVKK